MANLTLLDIAKLTGNDAVVGLIEENLAVAPEMRVIPARTISGTQFKTSVRTSFPTVGFRQANASTTASKSTFDQKLVECFILSSLVTVDKAVAMAYEDGPDALKAIEASGVMRKALEVIGTQVYYGVTTGYGGDAAGFPGLRAAVDSSMVIDAGGTTSATGSSVWLIATGPKAVQLIVGRNGSIELGQWREETVSGVPSFVADLTAWIGLQVNNAAKSIVQIKDCTADSGKGLTDALLAQAIAKFPAGVRPSVILCSRRSKYQLSASRTVTIHGGPGTAKPAGSVELIGPEATSFYDIPVVATDSLLDTETLT